MPEITQEDLLKLEMKLIKADSDDRHKLNWLIQNNTLAIDDQKTDLKLLLQSHKAMEKNFTKLEKNINDGFNDVKTTINGLDKKFATKTEHTINSDRIKRIEKIFIWLITLIWAAFITALLKLVLI